MTRYLVTGASGFIGRELVARLVAQDCQVSTLHRGEGLAEYPQLTHIRCDLGTESVPTDALAGIDAVVHLAGCAHQAAAASDHESVNFRGTVNLARSAAAAGVTSFVFVSSVKAMGPAGDTVRGEDDASEPQTAYGRSKLAAERALEALAGETSLAVTVLRPALVYGPGVKGNLAGLLRYSAAVTPGLPSLGRRSLLSVHDLTAAILAVVDQHESGYRCYVVSGHESFSSRDIQDTCRHAQGRAAGRFALPVWMFRAAFALLDRRADPGDLSGFDRAFGTELYSSAKLQSDTGWAPQTTFSDAMPDMLAALGHGGRGHD